MPTIDLNADLGEGAASDAELLTIVSSCNIACGGHAGDIESMRATIVRAVANRVAIGAHPSYPDRAGFGRRARFMTGEALYESLTTQVSDLCDIAAETGALLHHVKPHGALYTDAALDEQLADLLARVADEAHGVVALVGPPASALEKAAKAHGIGFVAEAFVDRTYDDDGTLLPRSEQGAVHTDLALIVAQALSLAVDQRVLTKSGKMLQIAAQTLCIHGDTDRAVDAARAVSAALSQRGLLIASVQQGRVAIG
ncbi:MAG TPA: 5-oxoprolinase subunit PxpA [Woeseiaceae bacterium]|nr:5-oxoprolinase subunit PxpA [Woeseiaceae bacterium]